jgi:hypothetical protein
MTEGPTPLSDILDNDNEGRNRDEQGRFAPKQAEPEPEPVETGDIDEDRADEAEPIDDVTPTSQAEPEPERIPFAALKDERAKRQHLENELAQLRQQIQQAQYQPPQQFQAPQAPMTAPDMFEDPEGYTAYIQERAAEAAFERAMEAQRIERVKMTAAAARQKHEDFDTVISTFQQMAQANPTLEQTMLQQSDPADWAYKTAKTHLEVSQYGSLEAAVEARVQARLDAKMAELTTQARQSAPPSLATERSVGSRTQGPAWSGPKPLSDILR